MYKINVYNALHAASVLDQDSVHHSHKLGLETPCSVRLCGKKKLVKKAKTLISEIVVKRS